MSDDLYDRRWVRYSIYESMTETIRPHEFTYSELLDEDNEFADIGFADVCEQHLIDSEVGQITFIPPEESDDGCYVLKRIK